MQAGRNMGHRGQVEIVLPTVQCKSDTSDFGVRKGLRLTKTQLSELRESLIAFFIPCKNPRSIRALLNSSYQNLCVPPTRPTPEIHTRNNL